jgi:glycosyltransferase involved in cell wall biosynthesis
MRVRNSMTAPAPPAAERPLRILMVLESNFTKTGGGGAESQLRTISRRLIALGHHVAIITPLWPDMPQVTAQRCFGIPVGRLRYPLVPLVGAGVMCARLAAFLLSRGRRYDAWHVHIGHHLGAVACLLGPLLGKPVIVKMSGSWEIETGLLRPNAGLLTRLEARLLGRANVVQAISTRIARELERRGFAEGRVAVLPNAIDTSRFVARTQPRPASAPFTAVFVGRLVQEKGLPTLLDGWAQAFAGRRDVKLQLVGNGPLEAELRAQVERLGIAAQVEFLGHRDHVEEVLADADVGLLPSRIEGLSNTLLEFMASGLPVIATRISGSEDFVVTGENGWLFPVADAAALARCLEEAASLSREQLAALGRNARREVETRAALDLVVGKLTALYRGADARALAT